MPKRMDPPEPDTDGPWFVIVVVAGLTLAIIALVIRMATGSFYPWSPVKAEPAICLTVDDALAIIASPGSDARTLEAMADNWLNACKTEDLTPPERAWADGIAETLAEAFRRGGGE